MANRKCERKPKQRGRYQYRVLVRRVMEFTKEYVVWADDEIGAVERARTRDAQADLMDGKLDQLGRVARVVYY